MLVCLCECVYGICAVFGDVYVYGHVINVVRASSGTAGFGSVTTNIVSLALASFVLRGDGGSGDTALGIGSYQMIGSSGGSAMSPDDDARTCGVCCVVEAANWSSSCSGFHPTIPFRWFWHGGDCIVEAQRLVMFVRVMVLETICSGRRAWRVVASNSRDVHDV